MPAITPRNKATNGIVSTLGVLLGICGMIHGIFQSAMDTLPQVDWS